MEENTAGGETNNSNRINNVFPPSFSIIFFFSPLFLFFLTRGGKEAPALSPNHIFSTLIYFNLSCFGLLPLCMRGGGWDAEERGETAKEIGISTPAIMKHLDAGSAMGFALMACNEGGRKRREAGGDRGWKLGGPGSQATSP